MNDLTEKGVPAIPVRHLGVCDFPSRPNPARGEDVVRAGNRHTLCSPGSRGPRALAAAGIFSYCLRRQRRGGRPLRSAPRRSLPGTAPTGALVAIACRAGRVPSGSGRAFCRGHATRKRGSGPAGKRPRSRSLPVAGPGDPPRRRAHCPGVGEPRTVSSHPDGRCGVCRREPQSAGPRRVRSPGLPRVCVHSGPSGSRGRRARPAVISRVATLQKQDRGSPASPRTAAGAAAGGRLAGAPGCCRGPFADSTVSTKIRRASGAAPGPPRVIAPLPPRSYRARGRAGTMGPCASPGPNPGNRSN